MLGCRNDKQVKYLNWIPIKLIRVLELVVSWITPYPIGILCRKMRVIHSFYVPSHLQTWQL